MQKIISRTVLCGVSLCMLVMACTQQVFAAGTKKEFYQIKIYQLKNDEQVARVDSFLREAYLPALHRAGIAKVGVFKPITNDTAAVKIIYVFTPFNSLQQLYALPAVLDKDQAFQQAGKNYLSAAYNNIPYIRIESILLDAFEKHTQYEVPRLSSTVKDKIYELRSYEGPTEKLYESKVRMFNTGDEVGLFKRLGFNAIFYANVISGSHMPNLMYMTSFENLQEREAHWKAFFDDPQWKKLLTIPEYQNTVSHADIILTHATDYSDF